MLAGRSLMTVFAVVAMAFFAVGQDFSVNVPAKQPLEEFAELAADPKATGKCPHWAQLPLKETVKDRAGAGGFVQLNKDDKQVGVLVGGFVGENTFTDIVKFDTKSGKKIVVDTYDKGSADTWKSKGFAGAWMPKASGKTGDYVMYGGLKAGKPVAAGSILAFKENGHVEASALATTGDEKPPARVFATLSSVAGANTAVLFGGNGAEDKTTEAMDDTWILTRDETGKAFSWAKVTYSAGQSTPGPRMGHSAAAKDQKLYVFGGANLGKSVDDAGAVFVFDMASKGWIKMESATDVFPGARSNHNSFVLGDSLYVVGGCDVDNCFKDAWEFKLTTRTWVQIKYGDNDFVPKSRRGKSVVMPVSTDTAILVGGCENEACDTNIAAVNILELNGVCDGDCKNSGVYKNGHCICAGNFTGVRCEKDHKIIEAHQVQIGMCPNNCSSQGICLDGMCLCHRGFNGSDCSQVVFAKTVGCPNKCSGNGACTPAGCKCKVGFTGDDCSSRKCPKDCSGHGKCDIDDGTCACEGGYTGVGCSIKDDSMCPNNCTDYDHGTCEQIDATRFSCLCKRGWGGRDCALDTRCPGGLTPLLACSGHGSCRAEKCECAEGFTGLACDTRGCPKDCNGQGVCNITSGMCTCNSGFADEDCSRKLRCPNANETNMCNGRGQCEEDTRGIASGNYDGVCKCQDPFSGVACELQACPNNDAGDECSARGLCDKSTGLCACEQGFAGAACELECTKKCSGNGRCFAKTPTRPLCDCKPGFRGVACQIVVGCPNNCANNGNCVRGSCVCFPGFSGEDCSEGSVCGESGCSGNGDCRHGKCHCHPGFEGEHCEVKSKCNGEKGCSGNGECKNGRCYCAADFSGAACEIAVKCPMDCSNRGLCIRGKCECQMGYAGLACEAALPSKGCPNNCTMHGDCRLGKCLCHPNWEGHACERYVPPKCPKGQSYIEGAVCSDRGLCTVGGKCQCYPGYFGDDCSQAHKCPQDCNLHGLCFNKKCFCNPGFSGEFCERREPCPGTPECMDRGLCVNGECTCEPGYGGAACEVVVLGKDVCPKGCSGHGLCQVGKCFCEPGFGGKDCSIAAAVQCPGGGNCNGNGECHSGECFCNPGWIGEACDLVVPCPAGCSQHGTCFHGRCFCNPGWTGSNCTKQMLSEKIPPGNAAKPGNCPNGCSMHGICFRGECMCQAGFQGIDCSRKDESWSESDRCPNDCRGSHAARASGQYGLCLMGQCYCYPGFTGPSCQEVLPLPCPMDCSSRGICSYGKCFCDLGYAGEACETKVKCPLNCNGNGLCHHGQCDCNPGFSGETCEKETGSQCKNACSNHGRCYMGTCWCHPGYEGDDCSILNYPNVPKPGEQPRLAGGPNKFNRQPVGPVVTGAKYGSIAHAQEVRRLEDRNTHGPVLTGAVYSNAEEAAASISGRARFKSANVELKSTKPCALNCGKHGVCTHGSLGQQVCECDPGFDGKLCESAKTCGPNACGSRGICKYGKCFCNPGFSGVQCEKIEPCPAECSKHGECRFGQCFCDEGFEGPACANAKQCPGANEQPCSGHGACDAGKCLCDDAHEGADCSTLKADAQKCEKDCNSRGLCHKGRCFCDSGFSGVDCGVVLGEGGGVDLAASKDEVSAEETPVRLSVFSVLIVAVGAVVGGVLVNFAYSQLVKKDRSKKQAEENAAMALPKLQSGFFMLDEATPERS